MVTDAYPAVRFMECRGCRAQVRFVARQLRQEKEARWPWSQPPTWVTYECPVGHRTEQTAKRQDVKALENAGVRR